MAMCFAMSGQFAIRGSSLERGNVATRSSLRAPTQALFGRKPKPAEQKQTVRGRKGKKKDPEPPKRKQSFMEALDFSDTRSYEDAKLLSQAKYGKRENGRMNKDQYAALRRKIGGTSGDFFKQWVDVQGDYTDKGYVGKSNAVSSGVPGLPFLIGVVVALFGATGYVATQF